MELGSWQQWRVFSFWLREKESNKELPWYFFPWKNRFSRFFFMMASISTTTAVVYSWQPFSAMLFAENVYSWKCTPEEVARHQKVLLSNPDVAYGPICDAQDNAIQALYIINMATEFILGAVAGISLDFLGPCITGMIGQTLLLFGVLFIAIASVSRHQLYIVSMIFLGAGANFLIFPAFSLSDYFPNHEGLIASLVIGLQNSSTAITSILDIIYRQYPNVTLQTLFISYLFFVLLPLGLFFILASPLIRPSLNPQFMYKDIGTLANSDEKTSDICNIIARADLSPSASERDVPKKTNYRRMIKQDLVTIEMLLIGVFTSATVLQFNFYPTILRDISGDAIARFNGWLLPTQGLIGVVYGLVIDKVGTLPVCHALLMMIGIVYSFCLVPSQGLQYVTTTIFVIAATQIYTVKFTFVQETFSPNNHGVLLGVLSLLGGLTLLINIPIHNYSAVRPVIYGMLISIVLCVAVVTVLQIRRRQGIRYLIADPLKLNSVQSPRNNKN